MLKKYLISKGFMLNKEQIKLILDSASLDKDSFIIISGAALVMYGIKEFTSDIDISVSKEYLDFLLNNYAWTIEKFDEKNNTYVYFIDDVINFSTNYYDVDYNVINGFKIQTVESILELKESLNREKDKKDIVKIKRYLNN